MRGRSRRRESRDSMSFDEYFRQHFGHRWVRLRDALLHQPMKVLMWNRYSRTQPESVLPRDHSIEPVPNTFLRLFRSVKVPTNNSVPADASSDASEGIFPSSPRDETGTSCYYVLDYSSALAVEALAVEPFHKVLDLCAGHGGKSIGIAQFLTLLGGELTCNEPDRARAARLQRTLQEFLPVNSVPFHISQRDGTRYHQPDGFDRILVDAPCTSERHVLRQRAEGNWRLSEVESIAQTQIQLVLRALECLKVGGICAYCTCSIALPENDGVVEQILNRTRAGVRLLPPKFSMGEPTKNGWIILPDVCEGAGPIYCALLQKTSAERNSSSESDTSGDSSSPSA